MGNVILECLLHVRKEGEGIPHVGNEVDDNDGIPDNPDQDEEGLRRYVSGVKGGTHRIHLRYAVVNRRVGQLRKFQLSQNFSTLRTSTTTQRFNLILIGKQSK